MSPTTEAKQRNIMLSSPSVLPALVGLAILLGGWWFIVRPVWNTSQAQLTITTLEQARLAVEAEVNSLRQLAAQYDELSATNLRRLDIALPRGADLPSMLAQLEGLVAQSKLKLNDLSLQERGQPSGGLAGLGAGSSEVAAPLTNIGELQVNLTLAAATYDQMKAFVSSAEQSLKLLQLTSLTFTRSRAETGYVLNFKSPYFIDQAKL